MLYSYIQRKLFGCVFTVFFSVSSVMFWNEKTKSSVSIYDNSNIVWVLKKKILTVFFHYKMTVIAQVNVYGSAFAVLKWLMIGW